MGEERKATAAAAGLPVLHEDPAEPLTEKDGRAIAVQMLREIEQAGDPEEPVVASGLEGWRRYSLVADSLGDDGERVVHRRGSQDNIVLRYLGSMPPGGAAMRGFAGVLTDFLATSMHAGQPVADEYDESAGDLGEETP